MVWVYRMRLDCDYFLGEEYFSEKAAEEFENWLLDDRAEPMTFASDSDAEDWIEQHDEIVDVTGVEQGLFYLGVHFGWLVTDEQKGEEIHDSE